jgi:flagellar biosynthesis protein FliR
MIASVAGDITAFFLVFCRVGACFMLLPGLSSMRVSPQIRLFAAVTISFALTSLMMPETPGGQLPNDLLLLSIFRETLIGAYFGLIVRVYLLALEFIAGGVAMTVGFGGMLGAPIEGTDAQSSLTSLISFSALTMLFIFDFHHLVLSALIDTYQVGPIDEAPNVRLLLVGLTDVLRESFMIALQLGSPFIGFAIIVNLAVGFINKLAVQIPLYFIALPFMLFGALFILYFSIPYMLSLFVSALPTVFELGVR